MKFIDLFAGLGGFHTALSRLGHKCVYACEIDPALNAIYKDIYGLQPDFDIKLTDLNKIPKYDILCRISLSTFLKSRHSTGLIIK